MTETGISSMGAVLGADGPEKTLVGKNDVFGWLVGAWELEVLDNESAGMHRVNEGEWHFSWVLGGRAIQDVLIVPRISQRRAGLPPGGNRYGSSLRVFDAAENQWRVLWVDPVQAAIEQFDVEKQGNDIVEIGEGVRNIFSAIERDSFRYRIETLRGNDWVVVTTITARRTG